MIERQISELKIASGNPRIADAKFQAKLQRSLDQFGDLGCIIRNRSSGELIGGNQRTSLLAQDPTVKVVITEELPEPNGVGTIATGYVEAGGEQYKYREVVWEEGFERSARIAANALHAQWDTQKLGEEMFNLKQLDEGLLELTGIDSKAIDSLLQGGGFTETPEGEVMGKDKVTRYTNEELKAHAARYATGDKALQYGQLMAFFAWLELGEQPETIEVV